MYSYPAWVTKELNGEKTFYFLTDKDIPEGGSADELLECAIYKHFSLETNSGEILWRSTAPNSIAPKELIRKIRNGECYRLLKAANILHITFHENGRVKGWAGGVPGALIECSFNANGELHGKYYREYGEYKDVRRFDSGVPLEERTTNKDGVLMRRRTFVNGEDAFIFYNYGTLLEKTWYFERKIVRKEVYNSIKMTMRLEYVENHKTLFSYFKINKADLARASMGYAIHKDSSKLDCCE